MAYDPWAGVRSRNGFEGDLLVSALQKSVRRGEEELAVRVAYEMYITSPQFEDKLWRRLCAISVEDVGFGDPHAPVLVDALNRMRREFPYQDGDRPLFFFMAIRYLCRCRKERSTDDLKNIVIREFERGVLPEIPDYAVDMHTRAGRAIGRDLRHFLEEASLVVPHAGDVDDGSHKSRLLELLDLEKREEEEGGPPRSDKAFTYSGFQY